MSCETDMYQNKNLAFHSNITSLYFIHTFPHAFLMFINSLSYLLKIVSATCKMKNCYRHLKKYKGFSKPQNAF